MIFKLMDTEKLLSILKDRDSMLTEALVQNQKFFDSLKCIRCSEKVSPIISKVNPFTNGDVLPNYWARCNSCGCEFEPYTKIEISGPKSE